MTIKVPVTECQFCHSTSDPVKIGDFTVTLNRGQLIIWSQGVSKDLYVAPDLTTRVAGSLPSQSDAQKFIDGEHDDNRGANVSHNFAGK